jgi:uncharacterized protein (TIGR02145 family)
MEIVIRRIQLACACLVLCIAPVAAQSIRYSPGTGVSDVDGNRYRTVLISDKEWMAENLRTTKYQDGSLIPRIIDPSEWSNLDMGGYSIYDNEASNIDSLGLLYNGFAVTDRRNVCPVGWRVPRDSDWWSLSRELGQEAGHKLKASSRWPAGAVGSDEVGMSAFAAGYRSANGNFDGKGTQTHWWSSVALISRKLVYDSRDLYRLQTDSRYGFSVRCIRNR